MKRTTFLLALLAVSCLAGPVFGRQLAPRLEHSAPFLGEVLTLSVEDAAPLQTVRLFESPAAGERALPYGLFELDVAQTTLAAQGVTDANGSFSAQLSLPADATSAEEERHYQALVDDPTAPAGAVLSEAVHARILGSRAYVGFRGLVDAGGPFPGGLAIVSAIHETTVTTVDFGAPVFEGEAQGEGGAVFAPDFARGAVMASPFELVLFDPFFGGIVRRVAFDEASPMLHVSPDGERLFVLETGMPSSHARVHVLDFDSGDTLNVVDLPRRAPGFWDTDGNGTAYIAEVREPSQRTYVRMFGLDDLSSHDSVAVGAERSKGFTDLLFCAGQVFVGTEREPGPNTARADLSRLAVSPAEVAVKVFPGRHRLSNLTPAPSARALFWSTQDAFLPDGDLWAARLSAPSPVANVGLPGSALAVQDMVAPDLVAWALLRSVDGDEPDRVFRLDLLTFAWTFVSSLSCFSGGVDLDVLRDAYVDTVAVTVHHCGPVGFQDAVLSLFDPISGARTDVPVGFRPDSLRVVTIP